MICIIAINPTVTGLELYPHQLSYNHNIHKKMDLVIPQKMQKREIQHFLNGDLLFYLFGDI
jgi:hypothetical protein